MRIAFISANREIMPDAVIPIGLLQVMATVPERHEKLFWDLCFESDPLATVADKLRQQQPDLVAIGLRNIQNMDYTNITVSLDYYRRLLATVRAHSSAPVVLGGGGFSVMPREMMEALGAEYGIAGEGERAFAELLEQLEQPSPSLGHIERLHYRVDGALRSNGSALEPLDVDAQPRADRSVLPERYYSEYGIESLQTKRGCPLHCEYCTYPLIEGARSRTRDPARVADEFMQICARPGVGHVFIVDSVFNLPPRHAKAVCRELVAHGNRTPWTSYVNPMAFDDELAGLMVGAGAAGVEVGSDSGCDEVLDRLRKGFRTDKIRRLAQVCRAHGLKDCHSFILGTRGETLDDVDRSLDFVEELDPFAALMLVWVEDREVVDARRERERREFRDAIYARLAERASRQPRWSVPRLGIRFDPRTFSVLRRLGMRGPLWQYLDREPARKSAASGAGSVDAAEAAPITSA